MTNSIGPIPSFNVSKPDSVSNSVYTEASHGNNFCSFRDVFRDTVRARNKNEIKSDSAAYAVREPAGKQEIKLKISSGKVPDTADKDAIIEELQEKLEELADMSNGEDITGEMQTLLESIKTILKELIDTRTGSTVQEAAVVYEKVSELEVMLERSQNVPELSRMLEIAVSQLQDEIKTAFKTVNGIYAVEGSEESANNIIPAEYTTTERRPDIAKDSQKIENVVSTGPDEKQKIPEAEKKFEYSSEQAPKKDKTEAASQEENIKAAVDGKVEKVTVEERTDNKKEPVKEPVKEPESEKKHNEAAKPHNKPDLEEDAVRQEQNIMLDKSETVQKQAAAPKAERLDRVEVISQIVKKAEVILAGAQSEMKMQLEPENLGRLTLRIAVERGLITARFTAESYEVKQAIESNFNELKDMLQDKGLEIQNISVSVGHDNKEFDYSRNSELWSDRLKAGGKNIRQADYNGYTESEVTAARVNPYIVHTGEFDQRA